MLNSRLGSVLCCLLLILFCKDGFAQQEIPADSLNKLQDTFGLLRDNMYKQNDIFWHRGEFDRCIAVNRLIVEIDPHDVEAYDVAAWLMQNNFKDDEAEAFLLKGLENNRDCYDMYFYVGYFYYMHEKFDEAIKNLESAIKFTPPTFVRHLLAHAYEHAGRKEDALITWRQAEIIDPADPVPHNQIERINQGGPQSDLPGNFSKWREERMKEEMNSK